MNISKCIFTLFISFTLYAQNYSALDVTYEVIFKPKNLDSAKLKATNNNSIKYLIENNKPTTAILNIRNNKSLFNALKMMLPDENEKQYIFSYNLAGGESKFYNDLISKEKIMISTLLGAEMRVTFKEDDWELKQESKQINSYTSFKAYLKSEPNIIAWYCPEIPVSSGPKGFSGLPGLILELQVPKGYFIAREIKFLDATKQNEITRPSKGKEISSEEYNLKLRNNLGF